ncbi:carboxylic ester hydrolase [Mycolicibacterium elephantis]|nr:carboxylic ester hydrolase [Mycolicibacterium elephantis]
MNAAGLVALSVPPRGRLSDVRHLALLPALAAIAQLALEGYRWQMVPAYVLAGAIVLWRITRVSGPRWVRRVAVGLGVAVFAVSAAVPVAVPVFRFPAPEGPYAIGTVTYHWRDDDRREIFDADPAARRELMAQVWYPAQAGADAPNAPYISDSAAFAPSAGRLLGVPGFVFDHFDVVPTHATQMPPMASERPRYPVLVFVSGLNAFRQSNTFQVEQLVSRGFVVVGLDQPYTSAVTAFPDGRTIDGWSKERLVDVIQQSITPSDPAPSLGDVSLPDGLFPYLAGDISFALDQLAWLDTSDPHGLLTGRLDLERAGAFGVSLGAITVAQGCHADPRLKACLMMDAAMPANVVRDGLSQPSMWLTRDADSILLERSRSGGWPDHEIHETLSTQRATFAKSTPGQGYHIEIPGMFHMNYTDAPAWTRLAEQLAFSGPIGGRRGHEIVAAYSAAFFENTLAGKHSELLRGPPPWEEVRMDRR